MAENPDEYNSNVKKLVNREGYKLRIDDWRIIIYDDEIVILVLDIDIKVEFYK